CLADRWGARHPASAECFSRLPQCVTCPCRFLAVVGPRYRRPPEGDDGIPDILVDHAAMVENDLAERVEVFIQQTGYCFRLELVGEFGKAFQVTEKDEQFLPAAAQGEQFRIVDDFLRDVFGKE